MANKDYTTIRIWNRTVYLLRRIRSETGEKIVEILHRLAETEFKEISKEKNVK